jgi:hypothetical protein
MWIAASLVKFPQVFQESYNGVETENNVISTGVEEIKF